jgi:hypothetical protein
MSINIRKAKESDAPFLAKMILQSSRAEKKIGFFDLILGSKSEKDVLNNLQKLVVTNTKNYCHFSNFLIADIDGKDVGSLCSYEPRISTKESFVESLKEIGCEDGADIFLEILDVCDFELNKRTLVFDFMEEVEGHMDVGILKALVQKSLLTARLKGYRIVQTMVEIGSLETLLYYKKLGFKEVRQKECELYKEKFSRAGFVLLSLEF